MSLTTRIILIFLLTLMLPTPARLAGQEAQPATDRPTATSNRTDTAAATDDGASSTAARTGSESRAAMSTADDSEASRREGGDARTERPSSAEVSNQFSAVLRRYPHELATILRLDPTLLSNEAFLTGYPEVAEFVAAHPEVRRNPRFFLREFEPPTRRDSVVDDIIEPLTVTFVFVLIAFALAWFVRTVIEQKRWNRLSRTQSEVHNKILDRFGTTAELLEYIKTPAGSKFLESAPIPLHTEPLRQNAPHTRVIWSIQIGVVVAALGLGMLLVSTRFSDDNGEAFFAMGMIAFCIGLGFIGSAAVSVYLSRKLGLTDASDRGPTTPFDEPRSVRGSEG